MKLQLCVLLAMSCASLRATVSITSVVPSLSSPQPLGTPVTFQVTATDTNQGPLTFLFNTAYQGGSFDVVRNFNVGTLSGNTWTAQPFRWAEIAAEGTYQIQVVAKDFATGETSEQTVSFTLTSAVSGGNLTVRPTSNALVALASVPPCPVGSTVRVTFVEKGFGHATTYTPFQACQGTLSSNFYLGGMLASTKYDIGFQIQTGSSIVNGSSTAVFKTGPLPSTVLFPKELRTEAPKSTSDTADGVVLHSFTIASPTSVNNYQPLATDLDGHALWYYDGGTGDFALLTRPQPGGNFLLIEAGPYWGDGSSQEAQLIRLIDLSGNVLKESNAGLMSQQLLALGATDMQLCSNIPLPAAVGAGCMAGFTHEVIAMPNGGYAVLASLEKIFPPGTQGDTTGLNVDIVGNGIVVLDKDLNVVWYWDAFEHDGGGNQLDINRPAVLGETCSPNQGGARCNPLFLIGTPGVTTLANDWLHGNSLQFRASDGDIVFSSRHQDWVMKIDFNNAAGDGHIVWRMGLDGDFAFNNIYSDPYPWFSGQHDAAFETNGVFDLFDNGNTRIAVVGSGNSRGMALTVDETNLQVTPVLSQDLGYNGFALGSAQLLSNGNYHFQPGVVAPNDYSYSIELAPTNKSGRATPVFTLESEFASYRSFRMPDLYTPPARQ